MTSTGYFARQNKVARYHHIVHGRIWESLGEMSRAYDYEARIDICGCDIWPHRTEEHGKLNLDEFSGSIGILFLLQPSVPAPAKLTQFQNIQDIFVLAMNNPRYKLSWPHIAWLH
jgi:hypothetical protein